MDCVTGIKIIIEYVLTINKSRDMPAEIETVSKNYIKLYMKIFLNLMWPSDIVRVTSNVFRIVRWSRTF